MKTQTEEKTTAQHTPTGLARSGVPEYQIHYGDDGECVAEIVHGEANARLFAAAPDLPAVLEKIAAKTSDRDILCAIIARDAVAALSAERIGKMI